MKTILSLTFLLTFVGIKAQNNLVVFSDNGEKFFLIINGVKQNLEAETNVKVIDLIQPNYKAKIIFEDKAKGVVDQNIYFMNAGEPVKNYEFVFSVGMKKKGGYKARPVSAVAIGPQTKTDPDQAVVHYSTTEPTTSNNNVISDGNGSSQVNVVDDGTSNNVQVNQTVTQTQTSNGGNTNVGVNMNGMGVNININDGMGGNVNTTTSQTVTTSSSGSTTKTNMNSGSTANSSKTSSSSSTKNRATPDANAMGTTASVGCSSAMNPAEFKSAKESIESRGFDDTKLSTAKQVIDGNCMSTAQVKEVMGLFGFEAAKLDFAKYAYGKTSDKNNYYKLNDALSFESSVTELNDHIKKNGK